MVVFQNRIKNVGYFWYRIFEPVFDPLHFIVGIWGYFWLVGDLFKYIYKSKKLVPLVNFYPRLHDKTPYTHLDAHYFYQQLWVFENVLKNKPCQHVDIGSTYQMSGYLSKIVKTKFVDYRPIDTNLKNLVVEKGDLLGLNIKDCSIDSLSCLHVIEHIGLGRYGDRIDPQGSVKAINELSRVLAKNGILFVSVPIGIEKLCFNAHRIFDPKIFVNYFLDLELISFSVVDDNGHYLENVDYKDYSNLNYGCGMFMFKKL